MNPRQFSGMFPIGSHLCREPMPPMVELKHDMENLKKHGFTMVKLQEHWSIDEPAEGEYRFDRHHELIGHAARLDLGVYLGLTCEQAPGWLYHKHPDCRMVSRDGVPLAYEAQTTLPGDGKPGPCFDHPGALSDQNRFIGELVGQLGRHENIVVWNAWQEVGYWGKWILGKEVCFCPHTLSAFRAWLCRKYGDLDGLNRAWNARYADWEHVAPSREPGGFCQSCNVDWRYFMDNVQIPRVLQARFEAITAADPLRRPVFAHKANPEIGSGMEWTQARAQDFLGSSAYPAGFPFDDWDDASPVRVERADRRATLIEEMTTMIALRFDYTRCCNPPGSPVWVAEFQGGPTGGGGFVKGRVPTPDDIRRWMLTAVASGVTAISFWVTRAEIMAAECDGFSLLDSTGDSTPRFEEAARVGRALNRYPELFGQPSWHQARVAIVVNERNYQLLRLMKDAQNHLGYDVRGWHRLLWEQGIPVDFIEASELNEERVHDYSALLLPFPLCLGEGEAAELASYVEKGGNLIAEACPGRIDEHAFSNRGELSPGMAKLCGVRHESLTMIREPGESRWSPREMGWGQYADDAMLEGTGDFSGLRLRANVYLETFTCEGGRPIVMHGGSVAGVMHAHGRGSAFLIGTFVGHNGTAHRDEETRKFVSTLFARCGVAPEHHGTLLRRRRANGPQEAWIFTNPTAEAVTEAIDISGFSVVEDLLGEDLQVHDSKIEFTVPGLDVKALVLSRGARERQATDGSS